MLEKVGFDLEEAKRVVQEGGIGIVTKKNYADESPRLVSQASVFHPRNFNNLFNCRLAMFLMFH